MSIKKFDEFLDEKKKSFNNEEIEETEKEFEETEEETEEDKKGKESDVELDLDSRESQDKLGYLVEVEHKPTYLWAKEYLEEHNELPPADEFYQHISDDHLEENDRYYTELIGEGIADEEEAIDLYKKLKKKK